MRILIAIVAALSMSSTGTSNEVAKAPPQLFRSVVAVPEEVLAASPGLRERHYAEIDTMGMADSERFETLRVWLPDSREGRGRPVIVARKHKFDQRGFSTEGVSLLLQFLPEEYHDFIYAEAADPKNYSYTWSGGGGGYQVWLDVNKGYMSGRIAGPEGTFVISPVGQPGQTGHEPHDLRLIDTTNLRMHPPGLERRPSKNAKSNWTTAFTKDWNNSHCSALTGGGSHDIDVMVLYTPEFSLQFPDPAAREASITSNINQSNQILADSGIQNARFRLVHTALAPGGYDEVGVTSLVDHLNWLGNEIEPVAPRPGFEILGNAAVNALADAHFADVIILAVNDGQEACGATRGVNRRDTDWQTSTNAGFPIFPDDGFVRAAYGVVETLDCGIGFMDFTHELGHLVGLEHDPANSNTSVFEAFTAIYPNELQASTVCDGAYGHRFSDAPGFKTPVDQRFRTVMAYSSNGILGEQHMDGGCDGELPANCQGIPIFSNPNLEWLDPTHGVEPLGTTMGARPTGTTTGPYPANNSLVFSKMAEIAAAYRTDFDLVFRNSFEGL